MKKLLTLLTALVVVFSISTYSYADANEEYHFEIRYEGDVVVNEPKSAQIVLVGVEGTLYTNVRVNVEAEGPAEAKVIAYDEQGRPFDMADTGNSWGPSSGFPVQGTFTNITPITITYPEPGTYTSTLQLIDLSNDNEVIVSNTFTINVLAADTEGEDLVPNDNELGNTVDELPQAGVNLVQCAIYLIIVAGIFFIILKRRDNSSN